MLELPDSPFIKEVVLANASLIKLRNALVNSNQGYWVAGDFKPFQKGVFSPALIIHPEHFFELENSSKFDKIANDGCLHPIERNLLIPLYDFLQSFFKVSRCTQLNMKQMQPLFAPNIVLNLPDIVVPSSLLVCCLLTCFVPQPLELL